MLNWYKNLKIAYKFFITIIPIIIIVMLINILMVTSNIEKVAQLELQEFEKTELGKSKKLLKNYVDIAYSSLNKYYSDISDASSIEKQKSEALNLIKKMLYNKGNDGKYEGYFWINDTTEPYPIMVMHPTAPQLDGKILDNKKYNCVLGKYTDLKQGENLFTAFVDVCKQHDEGYVDYLWFKPGEKKLQPKLSYVSLFKPWNWVIGSGFYIDHIEKQIATKEALMGKHNWELKKNTILLSTIITAVIISVIVFVTHIITREIKPMTSIIEKLSNKDLTHKIENFSQDEIGFISKHINDLIDTWRNVLNNIKQVTAKTRNVSSELSSSSTESAAATEEIGANITGVKQEADILDQEIKSVRDSVVEIKEFISHVIGLIQKQAHAVSESSSSIEQMTASIQNITRISEDRALLSEKLEGYAKSSEKEMFATTEIIKKVADSAHVIMDMISVINNIAEQTNLLAMNAAIEAAHAGDSGKGFAVVADEIRKLAEDTTKNSGEIGRSLKEVIEDIHKSEQTTENTNKFFLNILSGSRDVANSMMEIKSSMEELSVGSKRILESLNTLVDLTHEVEKSSGEMNEKTGKINQFMSRVTDISLDTKNALSEMSVGIMELNKTMEHISSAGVINSETVEELEKLINHFELGDNGKELALK